MPRAHTGRVIADGDFFVITPENAANFETRLLGFSVTDDGRIICGGDVSCADPGPNGCWVLLERAGGMLRIRQDFLGSWGLHLYRDGSWWALSNSFLFLVEHLHSLGRPLTFDKTCADQFLAYSLASVSLKRTMISEIELLDRAATVEIDTTSGALETSTADYRECTVPLDTGEGIAILDDWHERWIGTICGILEKQPASCDVSGGFDSRLILSLFLDPRVDHDKVRFSSTRMDRTERNGDWETACRLAEKVGVELNRPIGRRPKHKIPSAEALEDALRSKGFIHRHIDFSHNRYEMPRVRFGGFGGETLRSHWGDGTQTGSVALVDELSHWGGWLYASDREAVGASLRTTLEESLQGVEGKFLACDRTISPQDLCGHLYRETRCRSHFGRGMLLNWRNDAELCIAPLLDHKLQRLAIATDGCANADLLYALVFERYAPELLEVGFQGGRSLAGKAIEEARELNRRFPLQRPAGKRGREGNAYEEISYEEISYEEDAYEKISGESSEDDSELTMPSLMPSLRTVRRNILQDRHGPLKTLHDAASSPRVAAKFMELYAPQTYRAILERSTSSSLHPESPTLAILSIAWLHEVCDGTLDDGSPENGASDGDGEAVDEATGGDTFAEYIVANAKVPPALPSSTALLPAVEEIAHMLTAKIVLRRVDGGGPGTSECLDIEEADGVDVDIVTFRKKDGIFVRSGTGHARLSVSLEGGGTVEISLEAEKLIDANKVPVAHWIDYTALSVNGETLLEDGRHPASAKKPLRFRADVADGETAVFEISWKCHDPQMRNIAAEDHAKMREKLRNKQGRLRETQEKYEALQSSRAYRIGSAICRLPRKLRKIFKRD